jgi:hypothetical protein
VAAGFRIDAVAGAEHTELLAALILDVACRDASCEKSRRRTIDGPRATTGKLVKCAMGEAAAR